MRHAAAPLPQQRSDIEVNLMHADRFAAQGMHAQAIALYRTVGASCRNRGDFRRALTAFAAVARMEGPGSNARLEMGQCLMSLGQTADAARTLEQAGAEFAQRGFIPHALHAFRLAADAEPTRHRAETIVRWCNHYGRGNEAIAHLEAMTAKAFLSVDAQTFIGIAEVLLDVVPGHVDTLLRVGRAHLTLRQVHQAVEAIRKVLRFRPNEPDALEQMAEAFATLGKRHKAAEVMLRLAERHLDRGPTSRAEARRIINRGLMWDPRNLDLADLQRTHCDRPKAVAQEIVVADNLPPLDLSEFVGPYEQSVVELSPYDYAEIYDEPVRPHPGVQVEFLPSPA